MLLTKDIPLTHKERTIVLECFRLLCVPGPRTENQLQNFPATKVLKTLYLAAKKSLLPERFRELAEIYVRIDDAVQGLAEDDAVA